MLILAAKPQLISASSDGAAGSTNLGLDRAGFFERLVSPVLLIVFRPRAVTRNATNFFSSGTQIGVRAGWEQKGATHSGHVPAHATFFLGHTAAVNDAAARGPRSGDGANFRHGGEMRAQKVPRAG